MPDPLRLSIVMEWANVRLNGVPRAQLVLEELARQWGAILENDLPPDLPGESAALLAALDRRADLIIMSGDPIDADQEKLIRERPLQDFDLETHVEPGAEYYPLKNLGAARAQGGLLLFIDCDVLPDPGWLAHLVGSFGRDDVCAVAGQTYVAPEGLLGKAFALGWSYPLTDRSAGFVERKCEWNNGAFRTEVFRRAGTFPDLCGATRGAASRLRDALAGMGYVCWMNRSAVVEHPPPSGLRHLAVRALAHGRDRYMKVSGERELAALGSSVRTAGRRMRRGVRRVFSEGDRVGLRWHEIPAALAVLASYYGMFALGGLLTYLDPEVMGRRVRV